MDVSVTPWTPTRSEGLRRLEDFLPRAGQLYADTRSFDEGPGDRRSVSTLSPWIRHRLVGEEEVVGAVLQQHTLRSADRFIQEVSWRTYWKGWLEMHPGAWANYREHLAQSLDAVGRDGALEQRWQDALHGRTGIECLDAWARELLETGYLHHQARMWFASIWIFTLKLPWELGADFFLRHLLDGDPAANTLSWRWVAGLHTPGRVYLARPRNIAHYTRGRFCPGRELTAFAEPLCEPEAPPLIALRPRVRAREDEPFGLLLTEEDLHAESLGIPKFLVRGIAGFSCTAARSPLGVSPAAAEFAAGALNDGLERAGHAYGLEPTRLRPAPSADAIVRWARGLGVQQVITPFVPVGPVKEHLDTLSPGLARHRVSLAEIRRPWDELLWPHAERSYFSFRAAVPRILALLGLTQLEPVAYPPPESGKG